MAPTTTLYEGLHMKQYRRYYALIALPLALLTGCATDAQNARTLLDRLEFDEGEYGTFELEGTIDLNPLPMFSSNVHMKLEKVKPEPVAP